MLYLLNDLLTYGRCHKWIMYVMEMVFSPEIYAVMRLLLAADERTEEERLDAAKSIISLLNMDVLINPLLNLMALMQIHSENG